MEFNLIHQKKIFKALRVLVFLLLTSMFIDAFFFNAKKIQEVFYICFSLIVFSFKFYYYFNGTYDVYGKLIIDGDSVKIDNAIVNDDFTVHYFGYKGLSGLIYLPFFLYLWFLYPKSEKGIILEGINLIKFKNKRHNSYYFLSTSKDDYKNLKKIITDKESTRIKKWFL